MNSYCERVFHQIDVLVGTMTTLIDQLDEHDLERRPTEGKHSIGELIVHISTICEADLLLSDEKTAEEMESYYNSLDVKTKKDGKEQLVRTVNVLKERYASYGEVELWEKTTSYWGISYSRFEWLLEIVAHLYHHRGQLHAILVHTYNQDPSILLFE
ncbi:DinB family protein [Pontibacillus yanchengensis]|uniref:DinB family protein n=2 Tax=Pontibacillus yanchengensis TaxID=462910 RepID=A0ACC7VFX1_9BACI|nr:DinB family protein [Pontibacillus yanchengensis]MYL32424.1 DinB family protein [Pontibacillus yanchengensis]MYL53005.1 DinB family protein [Pontibacillus yanchengensis]